MKNLMLKGWFVLSLHTWRIMSLSLMLFALALFAIVLGTCTRVTQKTVSSENLKAVTKEVAESKLTDVEKTLYVSGVMRAELAGTFGLDESYSIEGKTVDEIIAEQREFEARVKAEEEAKKLAVEKAREKYRLLKEQLNKKVSVVMLDKTNVQKDWQRSIYSPMVQITFQITNSSDKPIRGIQGVTQFHDIFDNLVKEVGFTYDEDTIAPGEDVIWESVLEINEFLDEDQRFFSKDLDDLVFQFEPEQIVFADGEKLKADRPSSLSG